MGDGDFDPTRAGIVTALKRCHAATPDEELGAWVDSAAASVGVDASGTLKIDDYIAVCEALKRRGGLVAFVASMLLSTAHLWRAKAHP